MDEKRAGAQGREVLFMAGTAMVFGTETVIIQLAYGGGFSVLSLAATRFVLAVLSFLVIALLSKKALLVAKGLRVKTLLSGLLATGGTWLIYTAIDMLPASLAILFFYAFPSFTALVARLFFHGPRLAPATLLALLLSAVGLVLLYWSSVDHIAPLGVLAALLAALVQALRLNLANCVVAHTDVVTFNLDCTIIIAACYNLAALAGFGGGYHLSAVSPGGWAIAVYLSLVISFACMFMMYRGVRILGPVDCSLLMLLEPPTTAVMALLVFKDVMTGPQILGGALILLAVALPHLVQRRAARLTKEVKAQIDEVM